MLHAQTEIPGLTVPEFHGLELTGAGSGRHCRHTFCASSGLFVLHGNDSSHRGIPSRIQDLPSVYFDDLQIFFHKKPPYRHP